MFILSCVYDMIPILLVSWLSDSFVVEIQFVADTYLGYNLLRNYRFGRTGMFLIFGNKFENLDGMWKIFVNKIWSNF